MSLLEDIAIGFIVAGFVLFLLFALLCVIRDVLR